MLVEELQKPWQVQEKTMETDISVLKWVEDLEQRVVSADLHLKVRKISGEAVNLNGKHCSPFIFSLFIFFLHSEQHLDIRHVSFVGTSPTSSNRC